MRRWKVRQVVCLVAIIGLVAMTTGCSGFNFFIKKAYGIAPKLDDGKTITLASDIQLSRHCTGGWIRLGG